MTSDYKTKLCIHGIGLDFHYKQMPTILKWYKIRIHVLVIKMYNKNCTIIKIMLLLNIKECILQK